MDMENFNTMLMGLATAAQPINLLYCFIGSFIGTLIGVLPGIGPVGAIALLLPVTFHVPPLAAFIMFTGIMYGAQYGGSTTSILVNIPGEASSVMTCLDGYQMARKGRAGPALGMAAFASFIAGTLGLFGLVFLAPTLAEFGLRFGPPEYFALMAFGLTLVIYLARGSLAKALMMTSLGLILASVGLDPVSSDPRFTYGIIDLRDGVGLAQMVIGLFGVSEVLLSVEKSFTRDIFETKIKGLLPNLQDWKDSIFPTLRASVISFLMAIIPGISVVIPTFISYSLEKRISKHPERFGTGTIEGVAAPEAANNAAGVGTMIPLLSLGIPTGASSALVLGALLIYGLHPGPLLIKESPEVFWGVIGSMYIGNAMLLLLNLPLIGIWVRILKIPYAYLFSSIILFCLVGSYTINNSLTDMYIMILFGILGYLMNKFDYEPVPLILALVLGPMMENAFRRSMILSDGRFLIFFTRPISAILLALVLFMLISPLIIRKRLGETIIKETGG
jgi:putative tricarboxylic transport membrane protein